MKTFLAILGTLFLLFFFIGAFWPGMNFHAVCADDENTREWHLRKAAELDARIKAKTAQLTNEGKP